MGKLFFLLQQNSFYEEFPVEHDNIYTLDNKVIDIESLLKDPAHQFFSIKTNLGGYERLIWLNKSSIFAIEER